MILQICKFVDTIYKPMVGQIFPKSKFRTNFITL